MIQNSFKFKLLPVNIKNYMNQFICTRNLTNPSITKIAENIKKSVFISQSNDVFSNLAIEEWLYKNFNFTNKHILMLWQNDPCVVIGRHQNPWLEVNIPILTKKGLILARRNSGGGTVYHDRGNLNMTFFTPRKYYNRKQNLELITRAIFRTFGITVNISSNQNLTIKDCYKCSGTAGKLGSPNAYHHCTLLINVKKLDLIETLRKQRSTIITNATKSITSFVMNLSEEIPHISIGSLMKAIGKEYLATNTIIDKKKEFQKVSANDNLFPGISKIRTHLSSWDWCYGKTPDFFIYKSFSVPPNLLFNSDIYGDSDNQELDIIIHIHKGRVDDIIIYIPPGFSSQGDLKVLTSVKGCKFTEEAIGSLKSSRELDHVLTGDYCTSGRNEFLTECIRQAIFSA